MDFGADTGGEEQREDAEECGEGGHEDGAQSQECGFFDESFGFDVGEFFAQFVDEAHEYDAIEDGDGEDGDEADYRRNAQVFAADEQPGDAADKPERYAQQD